MSMTWGLTLVLPPAGWVTGLFTYLCVSVSSSVSGDHNTTFLAAFSEDELWESPCPARSQRLLNASWVLVLRASSYHGVTVTSAIPRHRRARHSLLPQHELWWGLLPSFSRWGLWSLEDLGTNSECHTSPQTPACPNGTFVSHHWAYRVTQHGQPSQ